MVVKGSLKLEVSRKEFKKIKRGKQTLVIRLNKEEVKDIKPKSKIVIKGKIDRFKKKVKEIHNYSSLKDLSNKVDKKQLGYKKNSKFNFEDLVKSYSDEDIKKYGLVGIELEKKKHIFIKVLFVMFLLVLVSVLLFLGYRLISKKLNEINADKMYDVINNVNKEKISYVFVEINPSFVLTVKDNVVNDVACLNDDCVGMYEELNVKGKNINDSIDNIYNVSKNKGYDVSNGVKIKSKDNLNIDKKDYYEVEYIDSTKEKDLLNEVKNNDDIKNINNDDYYSKLWEELKKDKDYDDVYTCNMNDNKELECYIILKTGINKQSDYDAVTEDDNDRIQNIFSNSAIKVLNTLKKFNFDVRDYKVYVNGNVFGYSPLFTYNSTPYKNALTSKIVDIVDNKVCDKGHLDYQDGKCQNVDGIYVIPLEKVNLLNQSSLSDNIVEHRWGNTKRLLELYEMLWGHEEREKERVERIKRCVPIVEAKGFYCCDPGMKNCTSCSNIDIERIKNVEVMLCGGKPEEMQCSLFNNPIMDMYCN